jgi:hypothetical protein
VGEGYPALFGSPYDKMEKDTGALVVYSLP